MPEFSRKPGQGDSLETEYTLHSTSSRGFSWMWEYLALTLSILATAALIAFLVVINKTYLIDWKAAVSPNTVISILAVLARAPLGFAISSCLAQTKWNWFRKRSDSLSTFCRLDDASRGPWGSFWLIIWLRASHVVVIGALVMITLLTFEPFLQAILSFSGTINAVRDARIAQMGYSKILEAGTYTSDGGGFGPIEWLTESNSTLSITTWDYRYKPDLAMVSAMHNGFYAPSESVPAVSYSCSTANCTWPVTTSLAVCSACNDVSSHIKQGYPDPDDNVPWLQRSLPYLNMSNPPGHADWRAAFMTASATPYPWRTISFRKLETMITSVGMLTAAREYENNDTSWEKALVTGRECALYFCITAIKSEVRQNVLNETIIASWSERDSNSYIDLKALPELRVIDKENSYAFALSDFTDGTWEDVPRNDLVLFIPSHDVANLHLSSNATRFNLTQNATGSMAGWINHDFFAVDMTWPVAVQAEVPINPTPPVMQALYESKNLTATFEQAARSLSNWMRDISNTTNIGTVEEWILRIDVEWPYIIVPLVSIILGISFCLYIIYDTRALGLEAFKTDMAAALTYSVDEATRARLRQAHLHGSLAGIARTIKVELEDSGNGLELRTKED
ncbi:hypothetical protein F5X98DRAFT_368736 [Xylaria grammica]|nr:hypothetical protein F5X98DRAFT_368736 [Xylaria grammica]